MRRIASINYPHRFFARLAAALGERAWVTVAWQGERPVCGTLSYVFRATRSCRSSSAPTSASAATGPPTCCTGRSWSGPCAAACRWFDYGRSRADNKGACGFKKNQGFAPSRSGTNVTCPRAGPAPNLKPSNPKFSLARRVWPRLPLPLTRTAGGVAGPLDPRMRRPDEDRDAGHAALPVPACPRRHMRSWGEVRVPGRRHDVWLACVDRQHPDPTTWPSSAPHLSRRAPSPCARGLRAVYSPVAASAGWPQPDRGILPRSRLCGRSRAGRPQVASTPC
jgi:hypothetical protein